ncbi:MAG TPA: hypothetical protein VIY27_06320 [Myxococcota bacterium]
MKRRKLEQLVAVLVAMVRRAAREMDRKSAAALLDDLVRLLHDYGWSDEDDDDDTAR